MFASRLSWTNRFGTHYGAKQWLNIDCCGLFTAGLTWFLILYGMITTTKMVIIPWFGFSLLGVTHLLLFNSMSLLAFISHVKAMTTNPGAVPKNAAPLLSADEESSGGPRYCRPVNLATLRKKDVCTKCVAFKPERAHHCSICNRCIVKMDHHCPWVNNCVGIGNQKFFMQFLLWIFVVSFYSLILNCWRFVSCMKISDDKSSQSCFDSMSMVFRIMFLFCESLLFGMFTCCMMSEQLSSLYTNLTHIDRLKRLDPTNVGLKKHSGINEIFGGDKNLWCHWSWLTLSAVNFPSSLRSDIMGYDVSDEDHGDLAGDSAPDPGDVQLEFDRMMFSNPSNGVDNANRTESSSLDDANARSVVPADKGSYSEPEGVVALSSTSANSDLLIGSSETVSATGVVGNTSIRKRVGVDIPVGNVPLSGAVSSNTGSSQHETKHEE